MSRHTLSSLIVLLSSVITLSFMSGCADDLRNQSVFDCGAGDAVIKFSVKNVILTRAGEDQDIESVVDHAYLLFFDEDVSIDSGVPVAAVRAEVDAEFPGVLKFKMPLRLQADKGYQLLALANADNYVPSGFDSYGEYIETWCGNSSRDENSSMLFYRNEPITPESVSNLPMSGGVAGNSVFRFSVENGTYKVNASLSFTRKIARIDIANIVKVGFHVEGILLCNWRDAAAVTSSDATLGNRLGTVQGRLSNESASEDVFITMPDANDSGIQQLEKNIYCFPSVSYNSYLGDNESTALIIKAKFGSDTQSTYYRVNVGHKGNVSEVKANTKYLVTIQSVNGSGASTPEEAYSATESQIVLSVVEDWDLEGDNFAMDDKGNFIVLSRSSIEFEGDASGSAMIRVLTSKGLSWSAEYLADDEQSASAFKVSSLSNSIVISPKGANESENPLSGKCRVSAATSYGEVLTVDIALIQKVAEDIPYVPVIPEDMPFALIPLSQERVKIDHEKRTIEIDGFDPDCFNSFIDVPFSVYINESLNDISEISISSTLEWPLEGRISTDASSGYCYCKETFVTKTLGQVYSPDGKLIAINKLSSVLKLKKDAEFNISVGAMGPDDPAILRNVILYGNGETIEYSLTVKPRPAIIDDIILTDENGQSWLIQDRNVQDINWNYTSRKEDGGKYQAYNYTNIIGVSVILPFKFNNNNPFAEDTHTIYKGAVIAFRNKNEVLNKYTAWLKNYIYKDDDNRTSPFYENENISDWRLPDEIVIKLFQDKIKVSKMRMYLVSEIPAKDGKSLIPICCYLPYQCFEMGTVDGDSPGYFWSNSDEKNNNADFANVFYFTQKEVVSVKFSSSSSNFQMITRLVRPLNNDEIEEYKQYFLGYGSSLKLFNCHPDTYDSVGWVQ